MSIVYYYPRTLRAIITSIANVFTDIIVYNYDSSVSGDVSAAINRVNISTKIGPQDKMYMSRKQEESGQKYFTHLPEIAIIIKNIQYDPQRSTGSNENRYFKDPNSSFQDLDSYFDSVQPVPYNIDFEIKVRTNSQDHTFQIFEQLLPIFNPAITITLKEFKFLNLKRNIRVKNTGTDFEFQEELPQESRREIINRMGLTAEAFLYKPLSTAKIIKTIIYNQYVNMVDVSGSNSAYNKLVSTYFTSGVEGFNVSSFPNHFSTSAYDPIENIYCFTSATGYF